MMWKLIEITVLFIWRHFLCAHSEKRLKYYGLPNEPYLSQCTKCDFTKLSSNLMNITDILKDLQDPNTSPGRLSAILM
jgi:hypothetical protein